MISKFSPLWKSQSIDWATPKGLFRELDREFGFTLDVCTDPFNALCINYCSLGFRDGLEASWKGNVCWMNPPYGRGVNKWIEKASKESRDPTTSVIALLPARTDTKYFHEWIIPFADEIRFIKGRLKFGRSKNSAPFPSIVIVWN